MKIQMLNYFLVSVFIFGLLTEAYVDFRQKIILDEILLVLLIAGLVYTGVSGHVWKESFMGALTGSGGIWRCKIRRGTGIMDRHSGRNCYPVPGVPDWRYSGVNAVYNA